ncbi:MAG: ribosome assembly cofactor RimP [Bacteroidales bacterium]|nr:ribosome assembly cofactor RimP [Bacteroidales bacterium]MBQ7818815.1 ribosome assembly cofactor RimP [Bacteroidales bacterium]
MIEVKDIENKVIELLGDGSTFLVSATVAPDNTIVVTIDDDDRVDIELCEKLHRDLEAQFDRDIEDYSLEVGSAGLTSPLVMPRQYKKSIGGEVEVLTKDGKKFYATLSSVSEEGFTVLVKKKVKPEGAKRKIEVEEEENYLYTQVKYVKNVITF